MKQLSSEPGCGAQTQSASRAGSNCWAPSPGGCAASVGCPTGGPVPAPPSTRWRRGGGKKGQGRVRVVACRQAPARIPVSIPRFLPAECGALSPGEPTSEVPRFYTAVRPGSQPRLSDPYWALLQQLGGRERLPAAAGRRLGNRKQSARSRHLEPGGGRGAGDRDWLCLRDPRPRAVARVGEQHLMAAKPCGLRVAVMGGRV